MWELSAISGRKWEDLLDLKKKKEVLADRLRSFDWTNVFDNEPIELTMLRSQIADLEYQSGRKIETQLQMIKGRIDALAEQKKHWLECLHVYARN